MRPSPGGGAGVFSDGGVGSGAPTLFLFGEDMYIRPIETKYSGARFRSRLEARWACFFNSLGLLWEYEKEGFDMGGRKYLPDFYLPHIDTWLEIKPGDPLDWPDHPVFDYLTQINDPFPDNFPLQRFIILKGFPWVSPPKKPNIIDEEGWQYCGYIFGDNDYRFCECPVCGEINITWSGLGDRVCHGGHEYVPRRVTTHTPKLLNAYRAAKSARFEFGEKG